ncbi:hypothetical protein A7A78_02115 [Aequorivita soesokkakensis]|uniref:Uncharacterized protein n=1 Tax=Aequorivita soesokkakensis TaxID=1385699 RepID=A0A1A9LI03_9FLAO|nr:hypothetical protein [Aequorivita soesokkakensis]OAD92727.1 hypothetical protein A7A78_02115 [Aequorivita soesokkakensis]
MEKLPNGITGFWKIGQKRVPEIDKLLIEKLIENFENHNEFWNIKLTEPKEDNNFYLISLNDKTGSHLIGINSAYPIFCGIKSMSDWTTVDFYNLPTNITDVLLDDLTELKTEFLNQPLKTENLILLNEAEIEQIKYWKTEKIGNVIFNKYD